MGAKPFADRMMDISDLIDNLSNFANSFGSQGIHISSSTLNRVETLIKEVEVIPLEVLTLNLKAELASEAKKDKSSDKSTNDDKTISEDISLKGYKPIDEEDPRIEFTDLNEYILQSFEFIIQEELQGRNPEASKMSLENIAKVAHGMAKVSKTLETIKEKDFPKSVYSAALRHVYEEFGFEVSTSKIGGFNTDIPNRINEELLHLQSQLEKLTAQTRKFPEGLRKEVLEKILGGLFLTSANIFDAEMQFTQFIEKLEKVNKVLANLSKHVNGDRSLSDYTNVLVSGLASFVVQLINLDGQSWESEFNRFSKRVDDIATELKKLNKLVDGSWYKSSKLSEDIKKLVVTRIVPVIEGITTNITALDKYVEQLSSKVVLIENFIHELEKIESVEFKSIPMKSALENILVKGITESSLTQLKEILRNMESIKQLDHLMSNVHADDNGAVKNLLNSSVEKIRNSLSGAKGAASIADSLQAINPYFANYEETKKRYDSSLKSVEKQLKRLPERLGAQYNAKLSEIRSDDTILLSAKAEKLEKLYATISNFNEEVIQAKEIDLCRESLNNLMTTFHQKSFSQEYVKYSLAMATIYKAMAEELDLLSQKQPSLKKLEAFTSKVNNLLSKFDTSTNRLNPRLIKMLTEIEDSKGVSFTSEGILINSKEKCNWANIYEEVEKIK